MTDPYQILGVDYRADEKQIKNAYKKMVKNNHPDRFHDPVEIEQANERMVEINAAFDQIMEDRRLGVSPMKYANRTAYERSKAEKKASQFRRYSAEDYARYEQRSTQEMNYGTDYASIRNAVDGGNLSEADDLLNAVPEPARAAEWHYIKGMVYNKRGWLNDAYHEVRAATQMSPGNAEYSAAFEQMNRSRSGYMTGGENGKDSGSCKCCDLCCDADVCSGCCECGCDICTAST